MKPRDYAMARLAAYKFALTSMILAAVMVIPVSVQAASSFQSSNGTVALSELPRQGQEVYARIHQGGPFTYEKDGVVFGNYEHLLPAQRRGFYHEYTVKTPGERNRGAKRIICGGRQKQAPDACYYTDDHYASFRQIVE